MSAMSAAAVNFADLQGLATLRRQAGAGDAEATRAVARQFEALFLNTMLRQMRSANVVDGGLVNRERMRFHEDLLDSQLALTLSQGRGIGLADAIARQLDGGSPAAPAGRRRAGPAAGPPASTRRVDADFRPDSPADFVRGIWPHARRAAQALGIAPEVLVAQAALETGWGQSMIRDAEGRPSFNLFGIKAGRDWSGSRAVVATLEFVDGVPERRQEPFRTYGSLAEGFSDYVALVRGSTRYRPALAAGSTEGYVRGLQAGGYATDPDYADKILAIVARGLPGRVDQAPVRTAGRLPGMSGRPAGPTEGEES